jgi:hypothetical protein
MASLVVASYTAESRTDTVVESSVQLDLVASLEEAKRSTDTYFTALISDAPNTEPQKKLKTTS